MNKIVAVDDSLSPITEVLKQRGYHVTNIGEIGVDAVIVNGMDDNFMGMEDILYDVPLVNAQGKTPEEVLTELKAKL